MKSTTQIHYQTSKYLLQSQSQIEEEASKTNGALRTSSSCLLPVVVSCLLQICVFGLWWWMGEAEVEPWHSPDVSFQPLQAGTIIIRSSLVESDEWPTPQLHAAQASTLIYHKRSSNKTEHIHSMCLDSDSCIAQIFFLSTSRQLALTFSFSLFRFFSFHDFLFPLYALFWKMLFASAQIIQEVGKGTRDPQERARREECKGNFFFQDQPAYKSNPITSPWFSSIVGLNGVRRRWASSREHIVGW